MAKNQNNNRNTGLAVNTAKTASEAIAVLEQKLSAFERVSTTPFKTGNPALPVANTSVKLQECTDVEMLQRAAGNVVHAKHVYELGANAMGLQTYKAFTLSGYSSEDWLHDLKLRHAIVNQHDIETKIRQQIDKLKQFVSKEEQFTMALAEASNVIESLG